MATRVLKFLIVGLLISALVQAQEAAPLARHPGDVIKYEIKFDGPNAEKLKTVQASMSTGQEPSKDQVGFSNNFGTEHPFQPISPKTFVIEMTIPSNAATGDYRLYVSAIADEGRANYRNGPDFNVPPIHVENPKTFTPPGIAVKPLP
jgi:hypothetical protein